MTADHRTQDAAFGSPVGACGDDVDQNAVAVHGIADGVGRDENVARQTRLHRGAQRTGLWNHEAEAVAVHGKASGDEIFFGGGGGQRVAVGFDLDDFSPLRELEQAAVEIGASFSVQA
jgi:hypothetical protein